MLTQVFQLGSHRLTQRRQVRRRVVAQPTVFRPAPHHLVWVQLRRVSRQVLGHDLRMLRQVRPYQLRLLVDTATVPHHRETRQVLPQPLEELHHVLAVEVLLVRQQLEKQPRPLLPRAERDGADGRDLVTPVPAPQDRRLPTRSEGTTNGWCQLIARFVEEDQVSIALLRFGEEPGELVLAPQAYRFLVTLPGPLLWLLAGPPQTPLEDLADMLGVIADVEVSVDKSGDACSGPQV